jgi:hypothetical protein
MAKTAPRSKARQSGVSGEAVLPRILVLRKQRVVLSTDLAALYAVEPKRLMEAVFRNAAKFPDDFCFVLTREEFANLKSQIATSSSGHGGARKPPTAFTEHGCLMAATVLRSERATQMSLYLVRAFVQMRDQIASNLGVLRRLAEIDQKLLEHDLVLQEVIDRLAPLLNPPPEEDVSKPKIGYHRGNR